VVRTDEKPRLQKLGMRPGARVAVLDVADPDLAAELAALTDDLTMGPPRPGTDLIFLGADEPSQLAPLAALRRQLCPDGAIWVVSRRRPGGQQGRGLLNDAYRPAPGHPAGSPPGGTGPGLIRRR